MRYVLPYCSVVVYSRCGFGYLFSCSLLFMFFLSSQPPRLQDECLEYDLLLSLPYCSGAVYSWCGFSLSLFLLPAVFGLPSLPPRLQDECLEYGLFTVSALLFRCPQP